VPRFDQICGHGSAHIAEANESDRGHSVSSKRAFSPERRRA
jgi:hypothetical protein